MNRKLLMTYDFFKNIELTIPYTYDLSRNDQHLFYFGSAHSWDPRHSQFKKLKNFWDEFLKKTKKNNILVIVENGVYLPDKNEKQAIEQGGESGLITFLAAKAGVEVVCIEPSMKYIARKLLKNFSRDEIAYHYFAQNIAQWNIYSRPKPIFTTYIKKCILRDKKELGWKKYNFDLQHMISLHEKIVGKNFNPRAKIFSFLVNPSLNKTVVNRVTASESRLRDCVVLENIEKFWRKNLNIFIVYGANHAIMQEPVIRNFVFTKQ